MKVFIVTYRDEFRAGPLELAAFRDPSKARSVVAELTEKARPLLDHGWNEAVVNTEWYAVLQAQGIPEDRRFPLHLHRHTNFQFEVRELELIE